MRNPQRVVHAAAFVAACSLLTIVGCADDRTAASLTGIRSGGASLTAPTLDSEINRLIAAMYKPGFATSVQDRWRNVKRETMKTPESRGKFVALVEWIQSKTDNVTPAPGETKQHAVARLVLLMSVYVYFGPDAPIPDITPGTDATLEIVLPTETDTVVTPSQQAAAVFPTGAVSEPTLVIIRKNAQFFPVECAGPLPTMRCQYPQFYAFDVFPDVKLNVAATVAVCHVNAGSYRLPRADHDRFRVAHQKPDDPAANHPDGVIEGDIEILPLVPAGTLTNCEENEYPPVASASSNAGVFATLVAQARAQAGRAARTLAQVLTPRSLYAIDRGGGATVFAFSDFVTIDPQSRPDLAPAPGVTLGSIDVHRGEQLTVNAWNVGNDGSGPSGAFGNSIVMAIDSALTSHVTPLAMLPTVPSLFPTLLAGVGSIAVTVPATLGPGTYFIGVRVDSGNAVAEENETNNFVSIRITVR